MKVVGAEAKSGRSTKHCFGVPLAALQAVTLCRPRPLSQAPEQNMGSRLEERCVITLSTASSFTLLHSTLRLLGFTLPAFHLIVAIACGIAGAPSDAPSPSSEHLFLIRLLVLGWPLTIGIGYWVLETLQEGSTKKKKGANRGGLVRMEGSECVERR